MALKETPLTGVHEQLGARIVEFAGFRMPVSYTSIIQEHEAVRSRAGLFDVSHMGEFLVSGSGARRFVNDLVTNDCDALIPGAVLYTVMCRENGTVVDDLLVYMMGNADEPAYMLVVNASNIDKDFSFISGRLPADVTLENLSKDIALLALQGPASRDIVQHCPLLEPFAGAVERLEYYHFLQGELDGDTILVSRTGYTGELGFEIYVPPRCAVELWNQIMEAGGSHGIAPVGLAARDTLRFEASFCLYGHELNDDTSPLEAGLPWVVKLGKESFIGKEALVREKAEKPKRRLIGLELEGRNIARQDFAVYYNGAAAGSVTSGTFSPTLKKSLCMALVKSESAGTSGEHAVEIRNKIIPAKKTKLPFYASRAKG
jgi:aminomethyltransferase